MTTLDHLMAETTVDGFRDRLISFFFSALIVHPYQGLASKAQMEKAKCRIENAVNKAINGHAYRGVRDIYLYIHLTQAEKQLVKALTEAMTEVADENPVNPELVNGLVKAFYGRLLADFESHHSGKSIA